MFSSNFIFLQLKAAWWFNQVTLSLFQLGTFVFCALPPTSYATTMHHSVWHSIFGAWVHIPSINNNMSATDLVFCLDYRPDPLLPWEPRHSKFVFVRFLNLSLIIVVSQRCLLAPLCRETLHAISSSRCLCVIIYTEAGLGLKGMRFTSMGGVCSWL